MKFYKYSTGDFVMRHKIIDKSLDKYAMARYLSFPSWYPPHLPPSKIFKEYFNKVSVYSLSELIQRFYKIVFLA